MGNAQHSSVVDTGIKEIEHIFCIEASPVEHIAYVSGFLTSENARQSCPVLVIDLLTHEVKCKESELMSNSKTSSKRGTLKGPLAWRECVFPTRSSWPWEEIIISWTFSLSSESKRITLKWVSQALINIDPLPFRSIRVSSANNLLSMIFHSTGDHFFLGRCRLR